MQSCVVRSTVAIASAFFVALLAPAGCSSSSGSSSSDVTVSGTIGGKAFSVGSAVAIAGGTKAANTGPSVGIVVATSSLLSCSYAMSSSNVNAANLTAFEFEIVNDGNAVTTGTYTVGDPTGKNVLGGSSITNATCANTGGGITAGTVTITALSASSVSGTYDLTISYQPNGTDHVSGTFDEALCDLPESAFDKTASDGGAPACQG